MNGNLQPPEPSESDKAIALTKALAGLVPGVFTITELLGILFETPIQRRNKAWQEEIADAVVQLLQKQITLEDLQDNDVFFDTVAHASRVASLTSEAEKHEALRNAIVNSGMPEAPESALQQMFVDMVERLTPWHLRILKLFNNPKTWLSRDGRSLDNATLMSSSSHILTEAYPLLRDKRTFYKQCWADLYNYGLVADIGVFAYMSEEGGLGSRTTEIGKQFLAFIELGTGE